MAVRQSDIAERLEACRYTRNAAAQSCLRALQKILNKKNKISELQVKNIWLKELNRVKDINSSGWYDPPPSGIGVLFAGADNFQRINYSTLREKDNWPKTNVYFSKGGAGYLFTSPFTFVDDVPIIGDFGFTFYLGAGTKIIDHFKKCYETAQKIVKIMEVGMKYNQLYKEATDLIYKKNLINNITSVTDKTGINLGHTIPFIDRGATEMEKRLLMGGDREVIHKVINKARIFINESEDFKIGANSAFTFEPRLACQKDKTLPMCSFHLITQFIKGKKTVLENFSGIINLLGMNWLSA